MRSARTAFVVGLLLLTAALALTLLGSPIGVAASNKVPGTEALVASTNRSNSYCQAHETLPRATSAIRVWLDATAGPRVRLSVFAGGRAVAGGTRASNWIGSSVTVPVRPLPHTVHDTTVCISFQLHDETVIVQGNAAPARVAAREGHRALGGRIWIEYLRPGTRSWLSLATEVARRLGLGRSPAGTWVALVALALLAAALALTSRLVLRELR
jgi:hypothetical protein